MHLDQQFIKLALPEARVSGALIPEQWAVSIDSRQVVPGDIFVAIKGVRVDGHDYIEQAIKQGASGIIISAAREAVLQKLSPAQLQSLTVIIVPDPEKALFALAAAWRAQFSIPVIGITGSIGKTSTKEMIGNILRLQGLRFVASQGNQNTAIGISLNILRMRPEHQVTVIEMGISKRGEMARMAAIARPTTAIITMIGHSHMEGLGSLQDIANEKRDIFKYFREDNIGIINGDNPILATISYPHSVIKFGCKTINQVQARKVQTNTSSTHFILKLYNERSKIVLETNHVGRINNALACAAVSYLLNIPTDVIIKGIQQPLDISGRFRQEQLKGQAGILINDCYNASPESMKAALLAFEKIDAQGQKIAILGDMLELGVNSSFWHRQLGRFLRKVSSLDHVILVGNLVKFTKATMPVGLSYEHVSNWQEALDTVKKRLDQESVILVKGSRSMQLSLLVDELAEQKAI